MVASKSQPCISYKIKHESGEDFDYVLHDPWIKLLFGHDLISPKKPSKSFSFICSKKKSSKVNLL
jgi:hypothetical protein